MHVKIINGVPQKYSLRELRRDYPGVSFPSDIPVATLAEYDVYPLRATAAPPHDTQTQRAVEGPARLVDGAWVQTWTVAAKTEREIAAELAAWRASLSVTPLQIRRALRSLGLFEGFNNYLASAPEEVVEEWEYAVQIDRNNEVIVKGVLELGMSEETVDDVFKLALTL